MRVGRQIVSTAGVGATKDKRIGLRFDSGLLEQRREADTGPDSISDPLPAGDIACALHRAWEAHWCYQQQVGVGQLQWRRDETCDFKTPGIGIDLWSFKVIADEEVGVRGGQLMGRRLRACLRRS